METRRADIIFRILVIRPVILLVRTLETCTLFVRIMVLIECIKKKAILLEKHRRGTDMDKLKQVAFVQLV